MKHYVMIGIVIAIVVSINSTCNQTENGPEIEIVKSEKIPRPFSGDMYFLFGSKLDNG